MTLENLKFASSSEIQETISNIINNSSYSSNDNNSASSQKISIKAYSSGNQVIVSGLSDRRKEIINLIEILDKPTKQVFVEAVVAELSTSKAKELRSPVFWFFRQIRFNNFEQQ